jgi:glycosyltransferase 2 family protein
VRVKRRIAFVALSVALGVAGAYLVGRGAVLEAATYRPLRPSAGTLLGSLACLAALWWLPAWRLRLLARFQGQPIGGGSAWLAHVVMMLGAAVTPSGSGGAPTLIAALSRLGVPWGTGMGIAIQIFILDLLALACLVPVSLAYAFGARRGWDLDMGLLVAGAGAVALVGALWLTMTPRPLVRLLLSLGRRRPFRRLERRLRGQARGFYRSARTFAALGPRRWTVLMVASVAAWMANFALLWTLLELYGGGVGYLDVMALMSGLTVVSFVVPTPGAAGFMELAAGFATRAPVGPAAVAAVVWWRLGTFYLTYLIGPLASWRLMTVRAPATGSEGPGADGRAAPSAAVKAAPGGAADPPHARRTRP